LWALISISVCVNLTEGSMTDWSSVYMQEVVAVPEYMTGWGFSVYASFMAAGRFLGDAFINRFGSRKVLVAGGMLVSAGLGIIILLPFQATVLVGFALVGFGVSTGSPVLYAAAAKVPGMAKGAGLATMNTFAMIGFMGGPAVIGWMAKWFGLSFSFAIVTAVAVFWTWRAFVIRKGGLPED
jgi:MFS family permease